MTLERKTLAIMASILLLALGVSYWIGQSVLEGFAGIEQTNAREHLQRAEAVFCEQVNHIDYVLSDWAAWDDSYEFVATLTPDYARSNLLLETFLTLGMNVCAFVDDRGQIVWSAEIDLARKEQRPLDASLSNAILSHPTLKHHKDPRSVTKGVILTSTRPLLVASRPIIHSNKTGPVRGSLIMGRFLDQDRIASMTKVLIDRPEISWIDEPDLTAQQRAEFKTLSLSRDVLIDWSDQERLSCSTLIRDIRGLPALIIRLHIPREIHRRGQETVRALLITLGSSAILFALLALRILKGQILKRIIQLDQMAQSIARSKDVSQRVPAKGKDELSSLAASFNSMLGELETTQEDLRKARDVAEAASEMKSRFLANVSHEIRTPLNCIIGFAETIVGSKKPESCAHHAQTILEQAEILLELINDLLDNAKIEAGRLELECRPFNLRHLLRSVATLTESQAFPKGLQVNLTVADGVPSCIEGDSLRMRQVLMNLVTNAVKFTEKGSVTIRAEVVGHAASDQPTVRVAVIDTGIGIPKNRQEAIFQSFCQVDAGTTRKYGGTGLGTTIARQLVELMGGQMGLESEPGQGSTFWFTLPVKVCDALPDTDLTYSTCMITPRRARILLAEDYPPSREMMSLLLEHAGHSVDAVQNGAELIAACAENRYDLIITDLQMPDVDGCQAAAAIRENSLCLNVPIIALTADSAMGARERFREVGVDDVIIKPVRRSTLLPALARCLSQSLPQPADSVPPPERQAGETDKPLPMDFESAVTEFGSDQIVNGVAAHFVADLERQTALMKQALEARDLETLCRNSHSIKGGAGTLIARPLAESALHLEHLSRTGAGRDQLASALANLVEETERLKAFLFIRSAQNSMERTAGRTVS